MARKVSSVSTLLREMILARQAGRAFRGNRQSSPDRCAGRQRPMSFPLCSPGQAAFLATGEAAGGLHPNFTIPTISYRLNREPVKHSGRRARAARRVRTLPGDHRCFGERTTTSPREIHAMLGRLVKMDVAFAIVVYRYDVSRAVPGE